MFPHRHRDQTDELWSWICRGLNTSSVKELNRLVRFQNYGCIEIFLLQYCVYQILCINSYTFPKRCFQNPRRGFCTCRFKHYVLCRFWLVKKTTIGREFKLLYPLKKRTSSKETVIFSEPFIYVKKTGELWKWRSCQLRRSMNKLLYSLQSHFYFILWI